MNQNDGELKVPKVPTQYEHAQLYHEVGISFFPLKYRDKRPALKSWKKYQEEHATKEDLERWYTRKNLQYNIAVVGGQISSMVFLDFDAAESYDICVDKEIEDKFLAVDTSGGRHHLWIKTDEDIESIKRHDLHFEVHSKGTYVVAPYSLHPSGSTYKFQKSFEEASEYLKNDDNKATGVQDIIDNFVSKLEEYYGNKKPEVEEGEDIDTSKIFNGYPCYEGLYKNGAEEGERDSCAIILISFLKNKRVKKSDIITLLLEWNKRNYKMLADGTKELNPLEEGILIDKIDKGTKAYTYSCEKLREYKSIGNFCEESTCRLNRKKKLEECRDSIINQTEKVIVYPGKPTYHEIHIRGEIFRATTKELMKPGAFAEWYYENFGKAYTRITLPKWEQVLEEWFTMAKHCKKEKVSDEVLIFDSIIDQISNFNPVQSLDDAIVSNTYYDTNNGSVLISSKNIQKLLSKECKSNNFKMSMNKFAVLLKGKEYLMEDSSIPRKVKGGKQSARFWKFSPGLFR